MTSPESTSHTSPARHAPGALPSSGLANGGSSGGRVAHVTVVVGEAHEIPFALQHPVMTTGAQFAVAAVVPIDGRSSGFPAEAIRAQVKAHGADTILVAGSASRSLMQLLGELAITLGCRLLALVPTAIPAHVDPVIIWEGEFPFIELSAARGGSLNRAVKRALDMVAAGTGLLLLAPVIGLLAVLIRMESAGSPFFGHERMGRGGRRFHCWKLRTMRADAEAQLERDAALQALYEQHDFKLPNDRDPRVTRLGRLLRRTSLDELPQLWNVLVGEMSLVGPRPLVPEELRHYTGNVLTLLSVRPGITGAWAVSGRHNLPYPRRAEVELAYVRSSSVFTDLRILLRTIAAVID